MATWNHPNPNPNPNPNSNPNPSPDLNPDQVRHYLYAVHRSGAYLTPPSLAARIYLLLLRWLARDFEGVYQMCACCASDSPLSAEEAQLWALLADFDDDMEPEAHACRLKLW